jgi:hypothetical protein
MAWKNHSVASAVLYAPALLRLIVVQVDAFKAELDVAAKPVGMLLDAVAHVNGIHDVIRPDDPAHGLEAGRHAQVGEQPAVEQVRAPLLVRGAQRILPGRRE